MRYVDKEKCKEIRHCTRTNLYCLYTNCVVSRITAQIMFKSIQALTYSSLKSHAWNSIVLMRELSSMTTDYL